MASPNSFTVTPENGGSNAMEHPAKQVLKLIFLLVTVACLWPALALCALAVVAWSCINTLMLLVAKRFPQFCGRAVPPAHKGTPSSAGLQEEPALTSQPANPTFGLTPSPGYPGFEYPDQTATSRVPGTQGLESPDTAPGLNSGYTTSSTSREGSDAKSEATNDATHNDHSKAEGWLPGKLRDKKPLGDFISGVRLRVRRRSLSEPEVPPLGEGEGGNDSEPSGELGKKNSAESAGSTDMTKTGASPMKRSGSYNQVVPHNDSGDESELHLKEGYVDSSGKSTDALRKVTSALLKPVSKLRQRKMKGA